MKVVLTAILALFFLTGCSEKIVLGKAPKSEKKMLPRVEKEVQKSRPESLVPSKTAYTKEVVIEQNITTPVIQSEDAMVVEEEEVIQEEDFKEEGTKKRFAHANLISSSPYKITIKTKKFAFSDTGFLNQYDKLIELQVFTMGKVAMDLRVALDEDDACVDNLCNTKHGFNQTFLSGDYPDDLMEKVLQRKPILGGKHFKKTRNGFMQKIITEKYAIKYKIWPGNVYFKDTRNGIILKLRKLPK